MLVQPNARGGRRRPFDEIAAWLRNPANAAIALTALVWAVGLLMILAHPIFVTNDSLSNYVHVWYAANQFWGGHGIPLHMPTLGHGDAFAFPYSFIPWMSAAFLRPIFGDWIVTLWLVVGTLGLIAAQRWAFPELRGGWYASLLLLNPMLIETPLLGQLPFAWAAAMLFIAIGLWRRGAVIPAAIMLGLAQATHPAVILPIAGPLVLARLYWEPRRIPLLLAYAASVVVAAPAAWIVLASPTVEDVSTSVLVGTFLGTVSLRAIVIGAPFIGLVVRRTPLDRAPALVFAFLVVLNVVLVPIRQNDFGWGGLVRTPDHTAADFTRTQAFAPGAMYRVLGALDGKVSMYQMLQAGARLDSEPFPESIHRSPFTSAADYEKFLIARHVDYVLMYAAYNRAYHSNEHELLNSLQSADAGSAALCVERIVSNDLYEVYRIGRTPCAGSIGP